MAVEWRDAERKPLLMRHRQLYDLCGVRSVLFLEIVRLFVLFIMFHSLFCADI